ncbi:helix-turn-helix domain-containing protein [candidate division KSB1 bacterium]|nr:helix-turn-helix domain-containing protein [candidate division KSB1 bacterium]
MAKKRKVEVSFSSSEIKQQIGARIKAFRKDQKLTQQKFGEIIGINFQHVSKYERGEFIPSFENLLKFIHYFSVNVNWLLTGEGTMYLGGKVKYPISEEEANQVIRDEDSVLGEIMDILRKNVKLKLVIYDFLKSFKGVDAAAASLHKVVEEMMLERVTAPNRS